MPEEDPLLDVAAPLDDVVVALDVVTLERVTLEAVVLDVLVAEEAPAALDVPALGALAALDVPVVTTLFVEPASAD